MKQRNGTTAAFEKSLATPRRDERYVLHLYVTGMTQRSTEAFAAIKALCEQHLSGRYDLEVIDIYRHPELAKDEQIIAVPTLVKKLPAPLRRLIGNLSGEERVMLGLDLLRSRGEVLLETECHERPAHANAERPSREKARHARDAASGE